MRIHPVYCVLLAAFSTLPLPAAAAGGVVSYIEASEAVNPAPSVALNAFDRFEIAPIDMVAPYAGQKANESARERLQANVDLRVPPLLSEWNAAEAKSSPPRVLRIEPTIRDIKFISGKARFWAGAFAGGSGVLMTVKLSDADTGEVIAEPQFYQHANAMGAAWSVGGTDKAMLVRVASLFSEYLSTNYASAVGGPTGREPVAKDKTK